MVRRTNDLRLLVWACLTAGFLLAAAPAFAEEAKTNEEVSRELDEAAKAAVDAAEHFITALKVFVDSLPQYAPPEVLENGDILIRRLPDKSEMDGETAE